MDSTRESHGGGKLTLEAMAATLNGALNNEDASFWEHFEEDVGIYSKAISENIQAFQAMLKENDAEERKEKGLEPRPWSELAKDYEQQMNQGLEEVTEHIQEYDCEMRKEKGLEPRSIEEIKSVMYPDFDTPTEMIKAVALKHDNAVRKKQGLEPRSWEEFNAAIWTEVEGPDGAQEGSSDGQPSSEK
ncbi:MAG: hypothetical protein Q9183_002681 [Haloplaca sp. 2 TL-2023]